MDSTTVESNMETAFFTAMGFFNGDQTGIDSRRLVTDANPQEGSVGYFASFISEDVFNQMNSATFLDDLYKQFKAIGYSGPDALNLGISQIDFFQVCHIRPYLYFHNHGTLQKVLY